MAEANITLAVERAVHDALRDAVQAIMDAHGVQVLCVRFDWVDCTSYGGSTRALATSCYLESKTGPQ